MILRQQLVQCLHVQLVVGLAFRQKLQAVAVACLYRNEALLVHVWSHHESLAEQLIPRDSVEGLLRVAGMNLDNLIDLDGLLGRGEFGGFGFPADGVEKGAVED